jgi:hypothetical protein
VSGPRSGDDGVPPLPGAGRSPPVADGPAHDAVPAGTAAAPGSGHDPVEQVSAPPDVVESGDVPVAPPAPAVPAPVVPPAPAAPGASSSGAHASSAASGPGGPDTGSPLVVVLPATASAQGASAAHLSRPVVAGVVSGATDEPGARPD